MLHYGIMPGTNNCGWDGALVGVPAKKKTGADFNPRQPVIQTNSKRLERASRALGRKTTVSMAAGNLHQ